MDLFFRRPLALFCALFAAATVCGCFLLAHENRLLAYCLGGIALLLIPLLLLLPKRFQGILATLVFCLLFAAAGLLSFATRVAEPTEKLTVYDGSHETVMMTVLEIRYCYDYAASYLVQVDRIGDEELCESAILNYEFDPSFQTGDILFGEVTVWDVRTYSSYAASYLADGIRLFLEPTEQAPLRIGHAEQNDPFAPFASLNHRLSDLLTERIDGDVGVLLSSLLLGNRDLLSRSAMQDFRRAGIVHMLAISGMHLALMIALTEWLLRRLYIHKNMRCVLVLLAALFYLALTGFSLSTVRAFIMATFVYTSYLFRADHDSITSLFFALFLILIASPAAVYDAGMWLSFSATLGILVAIELLRPLESYLYHCFAKKRRAYFLSKGISAIGISFAASFFTIFPAWLFFDEISLLSVPATLFLSPLASACLYLSPFFLLCNGIEFLSQILTVLLRIFGEALLRGASLFSQLHGCTVSLRYPFLYILLPVATLIMALLLIFPLRKKIFLPVAALIFTLLFLLGLGGYRYGHRNTWSVDYVRHADSEMFVLSTAETTVLCDMSSGAYAASYDALLSAKDRYATEIHAYVLTHYHNRHVASIRRLSEEVLVRHLYLPSPVTSEEYHVMTAILEMAESRRIRVTVYNRGESLPFKRSLSLYISEAAYSERSTHPLGYVAVEANENLLLYLGESVHESPQFTSQIMSFIDRSDAVILGLHGPITKTPIPFDLSSIPVVILPNADMLLHLQVSKPPIGQWILHAEKAHFSCPFPQ